jgi:hypothetical protein
VFAYIRFVRLERESGTEEQAPAKPRRAPEPGAPREIPEGLLPERPKAVRSQDPALAEYNKYLAQLHANDIDQHVREAGPRARDTERSAG